jgi:hypothetical protein
MSSVGSTTQYDQNSENFKASVPLVLGHLYSAYQEQLYLIAVSNPSDYAKVRAEVVRDVKVKIVNDLYNNLRNVLCKGELSGRQIMKFQAGTFCPNYPPNSSDSKILSIAKALDGELDDIIQIIIPPFSEVLHNRLESKSV